MAKSGCPQFATRKFAISANDKKWVSTICHPEVCNFSKWQKVGVHNLPPGSLQFQQMTKSGCPQFATRKFAISANGKKWVSTICHPEVCNFSKWQKVGVHNLPPGSLQFQQMAKSGCPQFATRKSAISANGKKWVS